MWFHLPFDQNNFALGESSAPCTDYPGQFSTLQAGPFLLLLLVFDLMAMKTKEKVYNKSFVLVKYKIIMKYFVRIGLSRIIHH